MQNTLFTRQERLNIQGAVIPSGVWLVLVAVVATFPVGVGAQSLRGSRASLDRQNEQAARHDFTFLNGPSQLNRFVRAGLLVPVRRTRHYALNDVSFPYTRPEVKLFIERLAQQYYRGCGEQLIVTSLTRPRSHQPRNASPRSVHPTGMALDLRRPSNRRCREWLESTLIYLEDRQVIEATRERGPPHYHVAVFPQAYVRHVANLTRKAPVTTQSDQNSALQTTTQTAQAPAIASTTQAPVPTSIAQAPQNPAPAPASDHVRHTVQRRDTLWRISRHYGTTTLRILRANRLTSSLIHPGQVLTIPVDGESDQ